MGLVQEPELRDYWSQDKTFHYSPIADKISRTRFEEISRYLHFVDSQTLPARGEDGHHRLQKVKNVVDAVKEKFLLVYKPSQNISVDEAMIPFKGNMHSHFTTYTGIRVHTNYVHNTCMYT